MIRIRTIKNRLVQRILKKLKGWKKLRRRRKKKLIMQMQ